MRGAEARRTGLPALEGAAQAAAGAEAASVARRDRQKALIADGIQRLVADLRVGETCPVCGARIERLAAAEEFAPLLAELDAECARCRREADAARSALHGARAELQEAERSAERLRRQASDAEAEASRIGGEVLALAAELGLPEATETARTAAVAAAEAREIDLTARLAAGAVAEARLKDLRRRADEAAQALDRARAAEEEARRRREEAVREVERLRHDADAARAQAAARKAAAGKLLGDGWETEWSRDEASFERRLLAAAKTWRMDGERVAELARACERMTRLEDEAKASEAEVAAFVAAHAGWTRGRLKRLCRLDVAPLRRRIAEVLGEVQRREGEQDSARRAQAEHAAARPADGPAEEMREALAAEVAAAQQSLDEVQREVGSLEAQLEADDARGAQRLEKETALKAAQAAFAEWKPLANAFGDQNGLRVQRILQSYVLKNVLVQANRYLAQLSDRYELACVGLTLTVRDAYEGGVERPAKTLSGGEGFLVSLALALGLAAMNDRGLAADVLFIDEGFGTLSGEHLNAAMDALERLNAVAGSRKVGVISHVAGLRERIRTHVEVRRQGREASTVRIVAQGE